MSARWTWGKSGPYGSPVCGIDGGRTGGAVTAAQVVDADDGQAIGVDRQTRSDEPFPPSGLVLLDPSLDPLHRRVEPGGVLASG